MTMDNPSKTLLEFAGFHLTLAGWIRPLDQGNTDSLWGNHYETAPDPLNAEWLIHVLIPALYADPDLKYSGFQHHKDGVTMYFDTAGKWWVTRAEGPFEIAFITATVEALQRKGKA